MESIQWFYRPSEQRKKRSLLIRIILGFAFHVSGIVYYFVYIDNNDPDINRQVFGTMLIIGYIIELLVFYLFLNKILTVQEKEYSLVDDNVEVKNIKNNKTKKHDIKKYETFSKNINVYDYRKTSQELSQEKIFYIGNPKSSKVVTLEINNEDVDRVRNILKERLREVE